MNRVLKKTLVLMTFILSFGTMWGQTRFWVDSLEYRAYWDGEAQVIAAKTDIVYANIPATVTHNGETYNVTGIDYDYNVSTGAFDGCTSLISVEIPESVETIGWRAFRGCSSLASIEIHEGITSIGNLAFEGCSSLTSIVIPNNVTEIGRYTFHECSSLVSVTIGSGVDTIRDYAFSDCSSLKEVTFLTPDAPFLGMSVFSETPLNKILVVECGSYDSYAKNSDWTNPYGNSFLEYNIFSGVAVSDLKYCFSDVDNTAEVMKSVDTMVTTINIPATVTYNGKTYNVTSINDWAFYSCKNLTSIEIPENVTSIGNGAFNGCSSLTSVVIPNGVTSIDTSTFENCSSLTSVTIPEGVTSIGKDAFRGCSSLISINIPDGVTSIGKTAFYECSSLVSVVIPDGVTTIERYAFAYLDSLKYLTIGSGVDTLKYASFQACGSLLVVNCRAQEPPVLEQNAFTESMFNTVLIVPCGSVGAYWNSMWCYYGGYNNSTFLDFMTFGGIAVDDLYYCFSDVDNTAEVTRIVDKTATTVNIPATVTYEGNTYTVTSIGDYAFIDCSSLTSIEIPESVTSIGKAAFYSCSSLTSIEIPENVTSIGNGAFNGCSSLASVVIPNGVTSIGDYAFMDCSSLTSIEIPENVTSIGKAAFYSCSSLTSVTIPNGVTKIASDVYNDDYNNHYGAFENCTSLTSVTIGSGVNTIDGSAFRGCSSLMKVITLAQEPPTLGYYVFTNTPSNKMLIVPCGSKEAYISGAWNYSFNVVDGTIMDNLTYCFSDSDNTATLTGVIDKTITTLDIPATVTYNDDTYNVTAIGDNAFYNCSALTSVTMPDGVVTIGENAFSGCSSLVSANIPNGVTAIGNSAFENCSSLTSVNIPDGVTEIKGSLVDDYGDEYIYYLGTFRGCSSLTSVTIGSGVAKIGDAAFLGCKNLTSITLPAALTSIGEKTFKDCSILKNVTCLAQVPPTLGDTPFLNTPTNKTLTVPCDAVESYKESDWDLHFVTIICGNICDKPTDVSVSEITSNGATVTWSGEADSYEIQLNDGEIETVTANTKTYTDLQTATFYLLKVRSVCEESNSEWVFLTFTTQEATSEPECGEPTNLVISGVTENEATITWDVTADAYEIQLNDGEIETVVENSKTYTDLEPATFYFFKIRSVCGENLSQWVMIPFFETMKGENGLNDANNTMMIKVYPNPIVSNGVAVVDLQGLNGKARLMLMDAQGRVVLNADLSEGTEKYEIKTSGLSAGVYYLTIRTQEGIATEKLIVK